jgi:hypothetical protein
MCGSIDPTRGAILGGTLHSRVGACDPRGLFAKHVLNRHPNGARTTSASRWTYRGLLHAPLLSALAFSGAEVLEGKKNGLAPTGCYIQETRLLMPRRLTLTARNGALPKQVQKI